MPRAAELTGRISRALALKDLQEMASTVQISTNARISRAATVASALISGKDITARAPVDITTVQTVFSLITVYRIHVSTAVIVHLTEMDTIAHALQDIPVFTAKRI